eukprot:14101450-Alexandrium_andersonii.AAC.1
MSWSILPRRSPHVVVVLLSSCLLRGRPSSILVPPTLGTWRSTDGAEATQKDRNWRKNGGNDGESPVSCFPPRRR